MATYLMPVPASSCSRIPTPAPGGTVLFIAMTRSWGYMDLIHDTAPMTCWRSAAATCEGGVPTAIRARSPRSSLTSSRCKNRIAPFLQCRPDPSLQPRFVQPGVSPVKGLNSFPIDVHGQHVMAGQREPGGRNGADVSKANDCYFQSRFLPWFNRCGSPMWSKFRRESELDRPPDVPIKD